MNDLLNFFDKMSDRQIHKWSNYFDIYDNHFSRFRGMPVKVLEIGIGKGGSLQMWRHYFGRKADIFGIDIDKNKCFDEERIHCYCADQSNSDQLLEVIADIGRVDIVIDDGGHHMTDQITAFNTLYPLVSCNGIYVVEDTHTSYWQEFGGGPEAKTTLMRYMKAHVDKLTAFHSRGQFEIDDFTMATNSMHFYNSVVVIEKGTDVFASEKKVSVAR